MPQARADLAGVPAVEVRASTVHGRGVYVTRDLVSDHVAAEAHALILDRTDTDALAGHPLSSYLVTWDRQRSALPFGPLSFVNHSADPNAELVVDHARTTVQLVVRRSVAAGEELTVDYGPDHRV